MRYSGGAALAAEGSDFCNRPKLGRKLTGTCGPERCTFWGHIYWLSLRTVNSSACRPGLRGEKSTGLGMSIIKTSVELHHGRIWVESEEGHRASFFSQLPLTATAGVARA